MSRTKMTNLTLGCASILVTVEGSHGISTGISMASSCSSEYLVMLSRNSELILRSSITFFAAPFRQKRQQAQSKYAQHRQNYVHYHGFQFFTLRILPMCRR